ncbi:hypothetical protein SUNI508_08394 [Seiridium unicorne]|uniref:Uncharacterized protein n=1 Tax=Seiridium unicorne TaxID=138068 RepID=A0ABR2UV47_9PEZI
MAKRASKKIATPAARNMAKLARPDWAEEPLDRSVGSEDKVPAHHLADFPPTGKLLLSNDKLFKKTQKLIRKRDKLDRELIHEADRKGVHKNLWAAREELLKGQRLLKRQEKRHVQLLTHKHQQATSQLAVDRTPYTVKDEDRLRRLLEVFKAHLGPYAEIEEPDRGSDTELSEWGSAPASQSGNNDAHRRSAGEGEHGKPCKKTKLAGLDAVSDIGHDTSTSNNAQIELRPRRTRQHISSQHPHAQEKKEAGSSEKRQRPDQVRLPRLDDSEPVYDIESPSKSITDSSPRSGRSRTRPFLQPGESSSSASTKKEGSESDVSNLSRGRPHSKARSQAGLHQSLGKEKVSKTQPTKAGQSTPVETLDSDVRTEDSPTEQTLKAKRLKSTSRSTRLPKEWGPGSHVRDNPTRISGPTPPKMKTVFLGDPDQLQYDCLPKPEPESKAAEDPSKAVAPAATTPKRRSRGFSSSEWAGKSTTPIPPPALPYYFSRSTVMTTAATPAASSASHPIQSKLPPMRRINGARAKVNKHRKASSNMSTNSQAVAVPVTRVRSEASRSLLRALPGNAHGDRAALEDEKQRWRKMLGL